MREPLPLATIHDAVLEFLRGRIGYRVYQVREPENRHLVDIRPAPTLPPTQRVDEVLVISPPELVSNKVVAMLGRRKTAKGLIDEADIRRLLIAFPELKNDPRAVRQRLDAAGAGPEVLAAWQEIVAQEILPEDDEDKF